MQHQLNRLLDQLGGVLVSEPMMKLQRRAREAKAAALRPMEAHKSVQTICLCYANTHHTFHEHPVMGSLLEEGLMWSLDLRTFSRCLFN